MNPEEQIAALKQEIEALKIERDGWYDTAHALHAAFSALLDRITKDRTDRINQLPPEYAAGIAKEL